MKRKILVLDAHTNGHEAALKFIRKMGWKRQDCEIIFCGSHMALLKKLSEGPAMAVVPVHNSIAGEVTEVTSALAKLQSQGYSFDLVSELKLQINHCLLVPQHVNKPEELVRVMSHEKAMQQCGIFLDSIGITPERQSKKNSTGNAAKHVSRLRPGTRMGAIAPKSASKAYGLKVLAEGIQDAKKNITTFRLLENQSIVKPVTVGIIGYNGRFGKKLRAFFEGLGCTVIGSDRKKPTDLTNVQVVKRSDAVMFAVSIRRTVRAIEQVLRYSRPDQLFMDITSVKQPAITAMLKGKAEVVGLHPMFAPEVPFAGQTIVACPARLTSPTWKTWVMNMLATTKAKIKWSNGAEHDTYMATVQGSPHLANFASAILIMEMGISTKESLTFISPFYRVMFSLMGRLLSQDADLYAGISMKNPATVPMLTKRIKIEQRLLRIIQKKDVAGFRRLFGKVKSYFGNDISKEANELFLRLISVTKTLYGKDTAVLEFTKAHNQPGLLEKIARVFRLRKISLTGINSVVLDDSHIQFTISFGQPRDSDGVRCALEVIERWTNPRVKVVS